MTLDEIASRLNAAGCSEWLSGRALAATLGMSYAAARKYIDQAVSAGLLSAFQKGSCVGYRLPVPTSLYRFFDGTGGLLYIGITKNGRGRWRQHNQDKAWWPLVASSTVEHYTDRAAALAAEEAAIKAEHPRFNVVHNHGTTAPATPAVGPVVWGEDELPDYCRSCRARGLLAIAFPHTVVSEQGRLKAMYECQIDSTEWSCSWSPLALRGATF